MKKNTISILSAIALAVPLAIGGLTFTAPVTATNAEAQTFLLPRSDPSFLSPRSDPSFLPPTSEIDVRDLLRQYQEGRCTVYQLWDCDNSVVSLVAGEFRGLFDYLDFANSVAFPIESNGANQITFDTLLAESTAGAGTQERRDLIDRYIRTAFSNYDIDPIFTSQHRYLGYNSGYISPDDRERYDREIDGLQRMEAERRTCSNNTGETLSFCHPRIRNLVEHDPGWRQYFELGDLPSRSDGADQPAYDYLDGLSNSETSNPAIIRNFIFPDGRPTEPPPTLEQVLEMQAKERQEAERRRIQLRDAVRWRCEEVRGRAVYNEDLNEEVCLRETYTIGHYHRIFDGAGRLLPHVRAEVGLQITPIRPFTSLAEIEEIEDHRQATSDNRGRIVELQEEVTDHEDRLLELEPAVARNTQVIEALGNSVGVLSEAVTNLAKDTEKNTAGIALAYALDAPGLSYGKRFAITGALGQFRGESAVGFSGSFKAGEFVLISVGGGFAGSGDSSVTGGKISATYEW